MIVIIFIALMIVLRLMLPTIVKRYINKVLADLPGYSGAVEDIDISLLRGAYVINGMYLNVLDANTEVPFLNFPRTDISVEWKSLFRGKVVSEIIMEDPEVIYLMEDQEGEQEADVEDWTKALTDIVPLDINHFEVHRGKVALVELQAEPNIDLKMDQVEIVADNLRNVAGEKGELPSPITASARTFGDGSFDLEGKMDLFKSIPDMDISFKLENSDVRALNDFTRHYGKIDFEKGNFNVYGEMAIADSYLKGYVKPFINDSRLIGAEDSFTNAMWEGFVGLFKFILKNQRTNNLAMKVPLEGNLENVNVNTWQTFVSILQNAWIKAFNTATDDEIDYEDATGHTEKEPKKMDRKERKAAREKEMDKMDENIDPKSDK